MEVPTTRLHEPKKFGECAGRQQVGNRLVPRPERYRSWKHCCGGDARVRSNIEAATALLVARDVAGVSFGASCNAFLASVCERLKCFASIVRGESALEKTFVIG